MFRTIPIALASVAAIIMMVPAMAPAQSADVPIEWKIDRVKSPDKVHLSLEWRTRGSRSMWTTDHRVADLAGLNTGQLSQGGPVRFAMVRPAGRLDCSGTGGNGGGRGTCGFTPDAGFARYVAAQGLGTPSWTQSLSLTMHDVGQPLIASMSSIRSLRPTIDDLTSMAIHGVKPDMVQAVARSRLPLRSADEITALRIHGADAAWIEGLATFAPRLRHLTGDDLVSLRIHGAKPEWIGEMAAAMGPRFATVSGSDLTSMRIHGAKPAMVAAYIRTFGGNISGSDITSMAIHGVSADFIAKVAARGYRNVPASELVSMRIHGIPSERRAER
jgi:hypothetical protein